MRGSVSMHAIAYGERGAACTCRRSFGLAALPGAGYDTHTHKVRRQRDAMLGLAAMLMAGAFTFRPGRNAPVVFGG